MENFNLHTDFFAWRNEMLRKGGSIYLEYLQQQLRNSGTAHGSAFSAAIDIMPEQEDDQIQWKNIHSALFQQAAKLKTKDDIMGRKDSDKMREDINQLNNILYEGDYFPSIFEDRVRRESFGHLIKLIYDSNMFEGEDYNDIAYRLFKDYTVIDGGSKAKIAFSTKELEMRGITKEDLLDSARYPILKALKEGKELLFEHQDGISYGVEALRKVKENIHGGNKTLWSAIQPTSDGEGIEVVIVSGDRSENRTREVVGRWVYKNEDGSTSRLEYRNDDMFRVLSAYKRGNFMDIENDDGIYDQVKGWVDKYKDNYKFPRKYIMKGTEEIFGGDWRDQTFFDIGEFEYTQVVKPFWDKYGPKGENLTPEEFADKWEEVRLEETYSWEDKYFKLFSNGLVDPYHPFVDPGLMELRLLQQGRIGTGRGSKEFVDELNRQYQARRFGFIQ